VVVLPTFGQQTQVSHGGKQIQLSYSCWGTKATKSPCYERLNFRQPHPRQKWNEKKAVDRMKKETKLEWDEFQAQVQQTELVH